MRILIVDDEPFVLTLLSLQLGMLGFTDVGTVACGHEALRLLRRGDDIDLLFCDLLMPGFDGVQFLRALAGMQFPGAVVLMSGGDDRTLQAAGRLASAYGLRVRGALRKPIALAELHRLRVLDGTSDRNPVVCRKIYGEDAVRRAIDNGELVNWYQPQVDMSSGLVTGVETLVRWQHPQDGLVLPDQFIPVAERHRSISRLTEVVIDGALEHARLWYAAGHRLNVAVNVSMEDIADLEFADALVERVRRSGLPSAALTIEVTESRLAGDPVAALHTLTRLRLHGMRLSIDDFGVGYSTLAQLHELPFDELKVDRGFTHRTCHDPELRAIFDTSVGLAGRLGMRCVAEGIEDHDDWQFVRASGCDVGQGYFISKAMPAKAVVPFCNRWREQLQNDSALTPVRPVLAEGPAAIRD